jgi:hypothetical protein
VHSFVTYTCYNIYFIITKVYIYIYIYIYIKYYGRVKFCLCVLEASNVSIVHSLNDVCIWSVGGTIIHGSILSKIQPIVTKSITKSEKNPGLRGEKPDSFG